MITFLNFLNKLPCKSLAKISANIRLVGQSINLNFPLSTLSLTKKNVSYINVSRVPSTGCPSTDSHSHCALIVFVYYYILDVPKKNTAIANRECIHLHSLIHTL